MGSITVNSAGDRTGAATRPSLRSATEIDITHLDSLQIASAVAALDSTFAEVDWQEFGRSIEEAVAAIDIEGIVDASIDAAKISMEAAKLGALVDEEVQRALEKALRMKED